MRRTLNKDRFCIEKPFVSVERCEEEGSVARRVSQQAEVFLVNCVSRVRVGEVTES